MNFGRQNIEIEADRLESHAGALGNKARSYAAKGIFVLFIALVIIGFSGVYGVIRGILADTPSVSSVRSYLMICFSLAIGHLCSQS